MNFLTSQIKLCHNLLIDMRSQNEQESDSVMTRPTMHWKKSSAAILTQTVRSTLYSSSIIYFSLPIGVEGGGGEATKWWIPLVLKLSAVK